MKDIFIEFDWSVDGVRTTRATVRYFASGPVAALDLFHKEVQSRNCVNAYRTVLRPKLQPSQYTIIRMFSRYADAHGTSVDSTYDLPATDNPDCTPRKAIPGAAQATMFDVEQC